MSNDKINIKVTDVPRKKISLKLFLLIEFIVVASVVYAIATEHQNEKLRNLILNYDKTKEVYNLQQDFKGGNY